MKENIKQERTSEQWFRDSIVPGTIGTVTLDPTSIKYKYLVDYNTNKRKMARILSEQHDILLESKLY